MTPDDLKAIEQAISRGFASSVKKINKGGGKSSYKPPGDSSSGSSGSDYGSRGRTSGTFFPVLDRLGSVLPERLAKVTKFAQESLDKTFGLARIYGGFQAAYEAFVLPTTRKFFTDMKNEFGDFEKFGEQTNNRTTDNFRQSFNKINEVAGMSVKELQDKGLDELVMDVKLPDGTIEKVELLSFMAADLEEETKKFMDSLKASGDAGALMTRFAEDLKDMGPEIIRFQQGMGLSSSELGTFLRKQVFETGEANTDQLKELEKFSVAVADATGVPFKEINRMTAKMLSDIEKFGNVSVDSATRITGALAKAGVAFDQFSSMVGQFQGFESAASSVGDLTAVFGVHLDTMDLMMKANEDQEGFMHTIRDSFLDQGLAIDDLNHAQKRLLSSKLGMDMESTVNFFRDGFMPDPEALEEATDTASAEDAVKRINDSIVTLVDTTGDFDEAMKMAIENKVIAPMQANMFDMSQSLAKFGVTYRQDAIDANKELLKLAGLTEKNMEKSYNKFVSIGTSTLKKGTEIGADFIGDMLSLAGSEFIAVAEKASILTENQAQYLQEKLDTVIQITTRSNLNSSL